MHSVRMYVRVKPNFMAWIGSRQIAHTHVHIHDIRQSAADIETLLANLSCFVSYMCVRLIPGAKSWVSE